MSRPQLRPSSSSILFDIIISFDVPDLERCTCGGGRIQTSEPTTSELLGYHQAYDRGDSLRPTAARSSGLIVPTITLDNSINKFFYLF